MRPISARSRKPMIVVVSIASMSWRASAGSSTGVLPRCTMWRGPRTAAAGLVGMAHRLERHLGVGLEDGEIEHDIDVIALQKVPHASRVDGVALGLPVCGVRAEIGA